MLPTSSSLSAEASSTTPSSAPDEAAGRPRGDPGAEVDAGDRADQQRGGEVELEVAEQQVAQRGRGDQRHGLDQVGADELVGLQRG